MAILTRHSAERPAPPIDLELPGQLLTATFALG